MKLYVQQFIFSLSLLLLVSFIGVESSNDHLISNRITRGSSISPNGTSYWLSDSGNIAFGFYPLVPCTTSSTTNCIIDQYVVGIWFVNSPHKTLVWTANRDDPPLSNLYSLIITEEGNFVLRADNKDKPLIDMHRNIQPVSYAKMHDNGNFVLYNAESQIIWESFDYPTDTILGGQILKDDVDLVSGSSGEYKLSINPGVGGFTICRHGQHFTFMIPYGEDEVTGPVSLNLDTSGELYFFGTYKSLLYEHQKQRQQGGDNAVNIYRATLDSEGNFNLYQERIDGNIDDDSSVLVQLWSSYDIIYPFVIFEKLLYGILLLSCILLLVLPMRMYLMR